MEIVRENFQRELPYIKEAINECEFIAIDAEFSGTGRTNKLIQNKTSDISKGETNSALKSIVVNILPTINSHCSLFVHRTSYRAQS
jgi:hypothetical protein